MFKIWGGSNQWLLRCSTFDIWGRLLLEIVFSWNIYRFWFGNTRISFKFGKDPTSGCWHIAISKSIRSGGRYYIPVPIRSRTDGWMDKVRMSLLEMLIAAKIWLKTGQRHGCQGNPEVEVFRSFQIQIEWFLSNTFLNNSNN